MKRAMIEWHEYDCIGHLYADTIGDPDVPGGTAKLYHMTNLYVLNDKGVNVIDSLSPKEITEIEDLLIKEVAS